MSVKITMKPCYKLLSILLVGGACLWFSATSAQGGTDNDYAKAFGVTALFLYDQERFDELLPTLKKMGFNTITAALVWREVEPRPGEFDFSRYQFALDYLRDNGFKVILILDSSGRELLDLEYQAMGSYAVPDWVWKQYPQALSMDFSDRTEYNLDFHDRQHVPLLERFYHKTLSYLQTHHSETIRAIVPGVMHELEIKYAQYGYRWQSYSPAARQGFATWLVQQGKAAANLPHMGYANNIESHTAAYQPLFADFMRYREQSVKHYVCRLTNIIRQYDLPAGGYFGQIFTSHDAIYALGVIEEVSDCFDHITVDYNYFDGWRVELNPYIPPLLVNYAYNLGYQHVIAGLYLEKYYHVPKRYVSYYLNTIQETLNLLNKELPDGLEIANIRTSDLAPITPISTPKKPVHREKTKNPIRVGIVASKWTYYLWIGEHSNKRNIIEDALIMAYRLLIQEHDFAVEILGERALLKQDLSRYDVLYLPHQTTLSNEVLALIEDYYKSGGRLAQDVQFNSYSLDGSKKVGWQNDLFGIAKMRWRQRDEKFIYQGRRVMLPNQTRSYFSTVLLEAKPGYRITMPKFSRPARGLILRGPRTLALGFLPQLVDDKDKQNFWQQLFVNSIRELAKR